MDVKKARMVVAPQARHTPFSGPIVGAPVFREDHPEVPTYPLRRVRKLPAVGSDVFCFVGQWGGLNSMFGQNDSLLFSGYLYI